jgi:anti-anti-sigma factor
MIEVEHARDAVVIRVLDDVDMSTSEPIARALEDARAAPIVIVSFERCGYLDSSGLTVLITAQKKRANALRLIVKPDSGPARILAIADLGKYFIICDSLETALSVDAS